MSLFSAAIPVVMRNEGSAYISDDNGRGPSRYGVTLETYREFYPDATATDILNMSQGQAQEFYRRAFWDQYHLVAIDDQVLATKLLDLTVNTGPKAIWVLQEVLGVPQDGCIGPVTAAAANADPSGTLTKLRAAMKGYYEALATSNPKEFGHDLSGWLARLSA